MPVNRFHLLHQRYQQQAEWTSSIRQFLLAQVTLPKNPKIMEVGCGTGVILKECQPLLTGDRLTGIDLDIQAIQFAQQNDSLIDYAQCNALHLPFSGSTFDLVFCHFFLLWASPIAPILLETIRVLHSNASFIAFAEPDYGARIDYPSELSTLGHWQETSLQQRGANTRIGRELAFHFTQMGLIDIEVGLLGGQWLIQPRSETNHMETHILLDDLSHLEGVDPAQLNELLLLDERSRADGSRLLFVPTFYAIGKKP